MWNRALIHITSGVCLRAGEPFQEPQILGVTPLINHTHQLNIFNKLLLASDVSLGLSISKTATVNLAISY